MRSLAPVEGIRIEVSEGHQIPIVNLTAARTGNDEDKNTLALALGNVCRDIGFFYVENHGVPADFLRRVVKQTHLFFELPESEKLKIHISNSPCHRGYFPIGEENALHSPIRDIKEGFDMALELPPDDPDVVAGKPFHGPNTWPESLPEFRSTMLRLYDEWRHVCEEISGLFAISLGLPEFFFADKTDKPLAQLRVVKYLPQEELTPEGAIGCGTHSDYGIVSLIWQIDVPGLQVQNRKGDWINAPRIPGAFVCPIGDMMTRWTNDYWVATPHRVINSSKQHRHAATFFFDPNYDCEISPLDTFVGPERPARHEPTTMGAHVARGFNGTFAYRKSSA